MPAGPSAGRFRPLVYDELRRPASRRLKREASGQTLQATALVHEPYMRLVDGDPGWRWDCREDPLCARLVSLRFFAGLTQAEAAEAIGLARQSADRHRAYARAWLYERLRRGEAPSPADREGIVPGWRSPDPDGALRG